MRSRTEIENEIKDEIKDELLKNIIAVTKNIDTFNGKYEDILDYYEFEELAELTNAYDFGRAIVYGNVTNVAEFIRYDGYGNLENVTKNEIERELENRIEEIIEDLIELKDSLEFNYEKIDCDNLLDLLEELEELEEIED